MPEDTYMLCPNRHPSVCRTQTSTKVYVVVLSGLQYDMVSSNNDLSNFVSSLSPDSLSWVMDSALPSTSLPNWVTMATGILSASALIPHLPSLQD